MRLGVFINDKTRGGCVLVNWQYYPKSESVPQLLLSCVEVFSNHAGNIASPDNTLSSNEVLAEISQDLLSLGFRVETGKTRSEKIHVPVLFGRNGRLEKYFEADAYHVNAGIVLEVEAGRGVTNYQFLKDLFQACMMHNVNYLVIAVRNVYRNTGDFEKVAAFFDTLYASGRLTLPLTGILAIGY